MNIKMTLLMYNMQSHKVNKFSSLHSNIFSWLQSKIFQQQNFIMLLHTSFAKSVLYQFIIKISAGLQLAGHQVDGQTLVILPFIAFLQDQVDKVDTLNIPTFNWVCTVQSMCLQRCVIYSFN